VTSLYAQVIRGKDRLAVPLSEFGVFRARQRLRFSVRLDAMSSRIPLNRLVVGDYNQASRSGLLQDFFEKTQIPHEAFLTAAHNILTNVSLPPWAVLFMLRCNQARMPGAMFTEVGSALRRLATRTTDRFSVPPGLDVATPEERRYLRQVMADDADRLYDAYGVRLASEEREPATYRAFDRDDLEAIRAALAPDLTQATRDAVGRL
jgi:hypothetical protein